MANATIGDTKIMSTPRKSNRLSDATKSTADEKLAEALEPSVAKLVEIIKENGTEAQVKEAEMLITPHETASTRIETAVKEAEQTRIRNSTPLPYRFCVSHFMASFQLVAIFKGASVVHAYLIDKNTGEIKNSDKNPAIMSQARADNKGAERACATAMALPETFYSFCDDKALEQLALLCISIPVAFGVTKKEQSEASNTAEPQATNPDGSINFDSNVVNK